MRVNISNRAAYTFIVLGVIVLVAIGVNALVPGGSPIGTPSQNPGHLISTVDPPSPCADGQVLTFSDPDSNNIGVWNCTTPSGSSSGGGYWTQSGSEIYYDAGFVGVGTNNPNSIFHVDSGGSEAKLILEGSNANLDLSNPTNRWVIQAISDRLRFWAEGDKMSILRTGQVGIGVADPTEKLEVYGVGDIKSVIESGNDHAGLKIINDQGSWVLQTENTGFFRIAEEDTGDGTSGIHFSIAEGGDATFAQDLAVGGVIKDSAGEDVIIQLG